MTSCPGASETEELHGVAHIERTRIPHLRELSRNSVGSIYMRKPVLKGPLIDPRLVRQTLASLLLVIFPFEQALQAAGPTLPSGGTFVAGSGTIAGSAGAVTIHQASSRGIIDWRNFSIGNGGQVLFLN